MNEVVVATIMRPRGETGVQTHFNCLIDYFSEKKISHQLITPFSHPIYVIYPIFAARLGFHYLSGTLSVWWYRYWHAYFLRLALKRHLQSGADCVIYAQCPLSADAALRARVSANQRVVMVTHFNISQADEWADKGLIKNGGSYYRVIREFETNILAKLDGLVFVSEFMRSELIGRIPAITETPNIVTPNFLPDPGLPKNRQTVADLINIGSLEARKNQQYLLEIIAELREIGTPLTLTLIGDGPDKSKLKRKAERLQINNLVNFAGPIKNAAELIDSHKACIHVATIENLPVTLIEAIARGRPLFVAAVGGIPELMGDGSLGLALPLNDAKAAARLIAKAIKDPEWMQAAGFAARQRFLKVYTSDVVAQKLNRFLQNLSS